MLAKLAWRNIWRNRRRTIITAASIVFAVLLSVLMDSVKDGILDKMKENVVGLYTGYAQIHSSGYWAQRTLENSFHQAQDLKRRVAAHADVRTVIPRLESFTLAASQDHSKGSMIVSIDPAGEAAVTNLDDKVVSGSYLEGDDQAVLVTEGLANYLRLTIEDSIVLLGQGFQGATAVGKYPIKGLVKFGSPELNQGLIYIPLEEGQKFFGAEQRLTAFVLMLRDIDGAEEVAGRLASELGADFEVLSWQEMSPELDQFIQGESTENVVFQVVLYLLIAFGIFGTILMMMLERQREFGILIAIGMKKTSLSSMVVLENLMISFLGVAGGLLLSIPAAYYFYTYPISLTGKLAEAYENFGLEPIFYFSVEPDIFYTQALVVLLLASVLSLFPVVKIAVLQPVSAMRK